jgi:predicted RNA-binding protein associated with RNAse of E/G family
VCLKAPADRDVDIVISAELGSFTKVWLGYCGLIDAIERGQISLHGSRRAMMTARRVLALPDDPTLKSFRFSAWTSASAIPAQ